MNKIITYIQESRNELLQKVTWPTFSELQRNVVVVLIASLIIAMLIFVMDTAFENLVKLFYGL